MRNFFKFLPWVLLFLVFEWMVYENSRYERRIGELENRPCANIEAAKAAAFKQGIWYYRTTVLGQCLPQE